MGENVNDAIETKDHIIKNMRMLTYTFSEKISHQSGKLSGDDIQKFIDQLSLLKCRITEVNAIIEKSIVG